MTQRTIDRTEPYWDLREQRRPTVWLVTRTTDSNPSGAPQIRPRSEQTPTPAAKESSSDKDEPTFRQAA